MHILNINSQNRRDFHADYKCEHCGNIEKNKYGYDDSNFHQNVIPAMMCKSCGKKADHNYRALTTKYDESTVV